MKTQALFQMRKAALLSIGFVMALLAACAFDEGGGSDQPNRLQGAITTGDGIPFSSARVRLYSGHYNAGFDNGLEPNAAKLVSEVGTDKMGRFEVKSSVGDYFLEILSLDSNKIWIKDSISSDRTKLNLGTVNLAEGASLKGIVVSSQPVSALIIAGTHFQTVPQPDGKFYFPLLPPGQFRLVAKMGSSASNQLVPVEVVTLEPGKQSDLDSVSAEPNQILMFNFDTVENFSRLRGITFPYSQPNTSFFGGWWTRPQTLVSEGAFRKKSLHAKIQANHKLGFSMGLGYQDLSKMTAFSFWAKGTGAINVIFHSKIIPSFGPSFFYKMTLPDSTTWTHYKILPSQIRSGGPDSLNYTWERGRTAVGKITFSAPDTEVEIWLDDIRLEGMTYKDLGPVLDPGTTDALP